MHAFLSKEFMDLSTGYMISIRGWADLSYQFYEGFHGEKPAISVISPPVLPPRDASVDVVG